MEMDLERAQGIGDLEIQESAPLVRALLVQRLELIWRTCEPHMTGALGKPDPRFVEAGIRVLDRLCRLYRLDAPERPDASGDAGVSMDTREMVLRSLTEISDRIARNME